MNNKKINFLTIAFILFMLTVVSIATVSSIYARFVSTDSTSNSPLVGKFDVSESFSTEEEFPIKIKPGDSLTRTIIINNNSDVPVLVTVDFIRVTENIPLTFSCTPTVVSANTMNAEVIITISWDLANSSPEYAEMVDVIKLKITAKQTQ